MTTFFIESGTLRMTVQADDARKAALWAVHRAMQQILPMYDDDEMPVDEKEQRALRRGWMVLDELVHVSRWGFGDPRSRRLTTFDLVTEWNKLMIALARLEKRLTSASRAESACLVAV
jgi:hypothetical protein